MAQLVVRNLPEAVKARLKRRAELHGRSLEAEVRDILASVPAAPAARRPKGKGLGTILAEKLEKHKVSKETWDAFDRALAQLRSNRSIGTGDFDP